MADPNLFCHLCGTLLSLDESTVGKCPLCHARRDLKVLVGKEICYTIRGEDLIRRLGLQPLIRQQVPQENTLQQRAVVNDECPQCHHPQLEYYTKQLRSADEGQTVFYECPNCHHKFSQNM